MSNRECTVKNESAFYDRIWEEIQITDDLFRKYTTYDSPSPYAYRRVPRLKIHLSGILANVSGKRVLVYGCGTDSAALWFARAGAITDAIDISPCCVEAEKMMAKMAQVTVNCLIRDAHRTDLPSEHYDIIYGNAILHHMEFEVAIQEIHRLLKPGGMALFQEVMRGNFLLRMFRLLAPFLRTSDDHPLTEKDLKSLEEQFSGVDVQRYVLTTLPIISIWWILNEVVLKFLPLRFRIPESKRLYTMLDMIDGYLFEFLPFLRSQAWLCLIAVKKKEVVRNGAFLPTFQ